MVPDFLFTEQVMLLARYDRTLELLGRPQKHFQMA
jgi:hypothetical protein